MNEISTETLSHLTPNRVGSLVWWNIADTLAADPNLLQLSFQQHAPDLVKKLPRVMDPAPAARDAMQAVRASRPDNTEWVELGETPEELKLAFVRETRDVDGEKYEAHEVFVIRVNKKNASISTAPARHDLYKEDCERLDAWIAKYGRARSLLLHKALTRFVTSVVIDGQKGRRAKTHGGVFFVRKDLDEKVFDLMNAMQPAGMELVVVEVGKARAGQFAGGIEQSFLEQVSKLREDVENRQKALREKGKTTREETFASRLNKLEELKKEASVFQQLIGMATDDIEQALAGAQALTSKVLDEMKAALAAKDEKKDAA